MYGVFINIAQRRSLVYITIYLLTVFGACRLSPLMDHHLIISNKETGVSLRPTPRLVLVSHGPFPMIQTYVSDVSTSGAA